MPCPVSVALTPHFEVVLLHFYISHWCAMKLCWNTCQNIHRTCSFLNPGVIPWIALVPKLRRRYDTRSGQAMYPLSLKNFICEHIRDSPTCPLLETRLLARVVPAAMLQFRARIHTPCFAIYIQKTFEWHRYYILKNDFVTNPKRLVLYRWQKESHIIGSGLFTWERIPEVSHMPNMKWSMILTQVGQSPCWTGLCYMNDLAKGIAFFSSFCLFLWTSLWALVSRTDHSSALIDDQVAYQSWQLHIWR